MTIDEMVEALVEIGRAKRFDVRPAPAGEVHDASR